MRITHPFYLGKHEVTRDGSLVDYSYAKRRILIWLLIYSALLGVLSVFLPQEDTMLSFLVGCPLLILAVVWCHTDADERGHTIGRLMNFGLVFFFVLVFPIYIIRTRGMDGITTLFLTALFVAAMAACMFAAAFATLLIAFG